MSEVSDIDAAMLAFGDEELPSLFEDDDGGAADSNSSSALRFASGHPLNADEFVELLLAIDGEQEPPPAQEQERPLQVLEQAPQLLRPAGRNAVPKKKKKVSSKLSNKARDGRKEELMFLRKTVSELETRLSVLKISKKKPSYDSAGTVAANLNSPDQQQQQQLSNYCKPTSTQQSSQLQNASGQNADRSEIWREIARHQCDERDRSERKNIRLRLVLESQIKVAKSLEKFLMLKMAASSMDIGKNIDLQRYNQLTHYRDLSGHERDTAIFQDLLLGVEQMVTEVDAIYEANGLARVETTQISTQTRFDVERGTMRIEVCASKVLPFGVYETGAAVWNHYIFAKRRMPSRYYSHYSHKSLDATEDTIIEDFSVELHTKNKRGSFRMRQVTRRMVEEDRVVIVWRSYTDPLELSEQPLSGLRSFEKGYIVIRKSSAGVTMLQPCHIIYPCASLAGDAIMGDDSENTVVGALADFRRSTTTDFVVSTYQMVENVLLDQALKNSNGADREPSGARSFSTTTSQRLA